MPRLLVGFLACGLLGCAARHPGAVDDFRRLLATGEPAPRELVLTFFEVGIGDAILVEFPSGRTLLVDAGIGWRADHILSYLAARGIRRLDGLLLTHPHLDHYGGMERIVSTVPVSTFYHNGGRSSSHRFQRLDEALSLHGVARRQVRRGDRLDDFTGEGTTVEVLYPDQAAMAAGGGPNRRSIVLRIVHGSQRFLLAGDAEQNEEKRLLALEGGALAHDVLKLGHHASPFSGTPAFLEAVHPRLAIAQGTEVVNFPPVYPRPTPRIRRVLDRLGARLLTVAREGAIQVVSDGETIYCRTMAGLGRAPTERRERRTELCSTPHAGVSCSLAAALP